MFENLPHKVKKVPSKNLGNVWPECGEQCELNVFYKTYESCEGWIGQRYLVIWSPEGVLEYATVSSESHSTDYKIFGSDGGGTYFGFKAYGDKCSYFSCDPIDVMGSLVWLGSWPEFIQCISEGRYV